MQIPHNGGKLRSPSSTESQPWLKHSSRFCRAGCFMWYFRATVWWLSWSSVWSADFQAAAVFSCTPCSPGSTTNSPRVWHLSLHRRIQPEQIVIISPGTHWVTLFFCDLTALSIQLQLGSSRCESTVVASVLVFPSLPFPLCTLYTTHADSTGTQQTSSHFTFSKKRRSDCW